MHRADRIESSARLAVAGNTKTSSTNQNARSMPRRRKRLWECGGLPPLFQNKTALALS
jgi:hypothetical protein